LFSVLGMMIAQDEKQKIQKKTEILIAQIKLQYLFMFSICFFNFFPQLFLVLTQSL